MRNILSISKKAVIYFFIILFVYAAVSKLADFENFRVQVAQSPLLSAYATFIAYATVITELIIASMLCFEKTKRLGLYLFLGMMSAFTVYIYLILNYSPFVPCSCGGILEKMGWTEHLWFNIIITLLATAMVLHNNLNKRTILLITGTLLVSIAIVVLLFISSEHIMKRENPFVRRFMPHPVSNVKGLELPYNSYYIAGYSKEHFYLGNYTAPLHGLVLSRSPKITDTITLKMEDIYKFNFSSIKWFINNDTILLSDHTVGAFYKSNEQKTVLKKHYLSDTLSYSPAIPINSSKYVLRTFNKNKNNLNLSIFNIATQKLNTFNNILDEPNQSQDLFSNDGMLLYNKDIDKIIYVFYYKNKSFIFNSNLKNKQVLKTIDTISTPNFKTSYIEKQQQLKISEKAVKVNKIAATAGKYLFIASDRMGKNERKEIYKKATVIDVYNLKNQTYEYSFYFYHYKNTPITQFHIYDNYIIGIGKNIISTARFKKSIYE